MSRLSTAIDPSPPGQVRGATGPSELMLGSSLAAELAQLHPLQRAAALHDGNVVILAGPGAGKTRTLVARVGYLLSAASAHRGVAAITYTDAAAREVTTRLRRLGLATGRRLASRTVHGFCLQHVLVPYGDIAGHPLSANPQILDTDGSDRRWEHALGAAGVGLGRRGVRGELPTLTSLRRRRAAGEDVSDFTREHRNAVADYERRLRAAGLLDFDAMTHDALQILRDSSPARDLLVARFPHLVVDEYQDLGPVLHALVTLLLEAGMTVTAVGDPDQTMFEFQGADPRYLHELAQRDDVTPIRLTLNYRSGSALVAAGRAALGADRGYSHDPGRADPGVIEVTAVDGDLDAHADRALQAIRDLLGRGVPAEEIAVLYPGQTTLQQQIETALTAAAIPFDSERARRVPDGPLAALVSACAARRLSGPVPGPPDAASSSTRSIRRGRRTGGDTAATVRDLAATWHRLRTEAAIADADETPRALARRLLPILDGPNRESPTHDAGGFMRALTDALNLAQLASARNDQRDQHAATALDSAVSEGLTMAELAGGRAPGRLVLTTYHSAKGREFSAVILPGLVEGLVPFYFANQGITARELERARRLFYVAVTRAIDAVILIPGTHFSAWRQVHRTRWSRFVVDIQHEIDSSR